MPDARLLFGGRQDGNSTDEDQSAEDGSVRDFVLGGFCCLDGTDVENFFLGFKINKQRLTPFKIEDLGPTEYFIGVRIT